MSALKSRSISLRDSGRGDIGGYMWGTDRKSAIIGWEAAQKEA
jgi:hypothetical protein